ncbi:hypothetical protein [Dellaglioa carnosa]|uniref:sunset domain-containing protein n=1 Tax=Dellaglioa carnosa TaxID=2995136 RepID=UPI0022A82CCC|nr:hypothetical protein [Dellaglioa carnosa]MCZ2492477.1 hypothetical protein [Dellaglioa carnosa]
MDVLFALIFLVSIGFVIYYSVKRFQTKTKDPDTYNRIKNRVWYAALVAILAIGAGAGLIGFFTVIVLLSLGTAIYYIVRMLQTRKKDPATYNRIKNRVWYALLAFLISYIVVVALPQPSKTTTNLTDTSKVDSSKNESEKKKAKEESSKKESESIKQAESDKKESEKVAKEESESVKKESESTSKADSESSKKESESIIKADSEKVQREESEKVKKESESTKKANDEANSKKAATQQAQTTAANNTRPTNDGQVTTGEGTIIGNTKSMIYHMPGQAGYHISPSNSITFSSEQEAQAAGYRKSQR